MPGQAGQIRCRRPAVALNVKVKVQRRVGQGSHVIDSLRDFVMEEVPQIADVSL